MNGQGVSNCKPAHGAQAAAFEMLMSATGSLLNPVIQQLLNSDPALVHLKGWHGMTPLHRACLVGDYNAVLMFIQANSDVNAVTDFNETPLHYASKRGLPAVVHLLVQCGAKVYAKDNKGRSAVHHAAENGSVQVMKYFEESFAVNTLEVDNDLRSPMHIVCEHGHIELFTFLMNKGRCDLRQADCVGNLPIHVSAESGYAYITWSILCVMGVSVLHQTNKAGYTPVDLVMQSNKHGHTQLAPVLKHYSSKEDSHKVSGPIFKWYTSLMFPLLLYMLAVIISQCLYSYQFVVYVLACLLVLKCNMDHRMQDISRWPNPFSAGLFAGGIIHTTFCYFWIIYPYFYTSLWISFMSVTLCPAIFILYYRIIKRDPGTVTSSVKDPNTGRNVRLVDLCMMHEPPYLYCSVCDIVTSKLSKHCKLCDKCYHHMDHHCLFLLQCVASNNHVLFVWLLLVAVINMCFYCLACVLYALLLYPDMSLANMFWDIIHRQAWPFSLMCLNAVSTVWTVSILYQQYIVITKGCTSYFTEWDALRFPLTSYQSLSNFIHFLLYMPMPYMNPHSPLHRNVIPNVRDIPTQHTNKAVPYEAIVI